MPELTFSEHHGYTPEPAPIRIRQDAPPELRGLIPRLAYDCGFRPKTLRPLVCTATLKAENLRTWGEPNIEAEVRDVLDECGWLEVYDIIETIAAKLQEWDRNLSDDNRRSEVFASRINRAL